ncbi:hypothetical protein [Nocardioides insulae]|uniref:hypothetical protein n=1 Tax=Nocardioides insulae TaxID=394734 RepID=UPI0003F6201B|nr:hypothetical protein [Nocardioides insulae]
MTALTTRAGISRMFAGLCDDAAVFPPGNLPLVEAVPAHVTHRRSGYAALVGPLVLAATDLDRLGALPELPAELEVSLTLPLAEVSGAVSRVGALPTVRLVGLEVVLPDGFAPSAVVGRLEARVPSGVTAYVEIPRDQRRAALLGELSGTRHLAKFRTGGVRAALYPDAAELAGGIRSAVRAGVPFKATAGLHHAVRNTDPVTGFEQHGFLNLLATTAAALEGAAVADLVSVLEDRDGPRLAGLVRDAQPRVRRQFRSFGTCSVREPAQELAALGLLPAGLLDPAGGVRG